VVEGARLESVYTGNGIAGSNPALSAHYWKHSMPFDAYILKSLSHGSYYYGSSEDAGNRLKMHNSGKVRYTKGRRPWQLHYVERFDTRSEAVQRERFFKSIEGYRFLKDNRII
jgi:putative endonuclease